MFFNYSGVRERPRQLKIQYSKQKKSKILLISIPVNFYLSWLTESPHKEEKLPSVPSLSSSLLGPGHRKPSELHIFYFGDSLDAIGPNPYPVHELPSLQETLLLSCLKLAANRIDFLLVFLEGKTEYSSVQGIPCSHSDPSLTNTGLQNVLTFTHLLSP